MDTLICFSSPDVADDLARRDIRFTEQTDGTTIELLSLGLHDTDISRILGTSLQSVRNRIGRLLRDHGLSNRTHLATLHIRNQSSGRGI